MSGTGTTRTKKLDDAIMAAKGSARSSFGCTDPEESGCTAGATFGNIFDLDNYSDAISDVGDAISDSPVIQAVGKVMKVAAPFVAMIPGVGTIVGTAMYAVGSIAAHDRLDDVAIGTIRSALPSQYVKSYDAAVDYGYKIGRGGNVEDATIDLARQYAQSEGGDEAVAVFDMGVSVGKGRGLQDAGFKLLGAWVQGSDAGERAVKFAEDLVNAADAHKPIKDFLRDEAVAQFIHSVPALEQAFYLQKAIKFFLDHPQYLLDYVEQTAEETAVDYAKRNVPSSEHPTPTIPKVVVDWFQAAEDAGVPVEAIRAAIICIIQLVNGHLVVDHHEAVAFVPSFTEIGDIDDPAFIEQNKVYARQGMALAGLNPEINELRKLTPSIAAHASPPGSPNSGKTMAYVSIDKVSPYASPMVIPTQDVPDANDLEWLRGFDIGAAVSLGKTQAGPNQDAVRASIKKAAQIGFNAARGKLYDMQSHGRPVVTIDDMQKLGYKVAVLNWDVQQLRKTGSGPLWSERGFDIGTAVSMGKSLPGPGQDMIYNALTDAEKSSYDVARKQQYAFTNQHKPMTLFVERTQIDQSAKNGATLAAQYPLIKARRETEPSREYQFGFDVATGYCRGKSLPGPAQTMVRDLLGPKTVGGSPDGRGFGSDAAQRGFDAGQQLQFQITTQGGYSTLAVTPTASLAIVPQQQSAQTTPPVHHGFLHRFLHFFGFFSD